jgi:drug/metabolite transporter (DMT)-like permease
VNSRLGIALGVAGYFFFSLQDASNKWLVATLPVTEVMFVRAIVIVFACLAIGRRPLVERLLATPLRVPLALRGGLTLVAWLFYYTAARELPLAQLLTLYFAAPLMVTAMAGPVLKESVTPVQWISVGVGFAGVLMASDPFGVRLSWSTLLVVLASSLWALSTILARQIARRETALLQMLAANLVFAVVTGVVCLVNWRSPSGLGWVLLGGVGVLGGLGQFCNFEAVRHAPAAVMAPVEYSALLWAFILGYLIWQDIPTIPVWIGASLILLAGAILISGERRGPRTRT